MPRRLERGTFVDVAVGDVAVGSEAGAARGAGVLPAEWIAALEGHEIVERMAEDFAIRFVDEKPLDWATYPEV